MAPISDQVSAQEMSSKNAPDPTDMTLEELRVFLAPDIADAAVFDGWGHEAVASAAMAAGVEESVARLAFKGGAMDMIAAWIETVDDAMAAALPVEKLATMKIRERIRVLVQFRINAVEGREEALRRAMAIMAMPQNARRSLKMGWGTADKMWRMAGDTATDYNHYTKRAILSGLYTATLAFFIEDESDDKSATKAFLERRIDGVMKFEKLKAKLTRPAGETFSLTRFLGRMRYPAR